MTENESSKFRIREDDNPESQFQDEVQDLRIDKVSRRLTWITILIPCLVGVILFLAYRDIQTRVGQVSITGTTNVKTLSKYLEKRFSSVSADQKEFEKNLTKKISALEKTTAAVQKNLKEATTAIRYIRAARKLDNQKISNTINSINKTLTTLTSMPQDLENMAADMKVVDEKLSKELNHFSQSIDGVKNNLIKIQADIISLSSAKIDKKALDLALKNQQETYERSLELTKREINMKIASLERKVNVPATGKVSPDPKKQTNSPKTTTSSPTAPKPAPQITPPQETAASKPATGDKPAQSSSLPKPGSFIEQDIK